jgi:hypothetical protein
MVSWPNGITAPAAIRYRKVVLDHAFGMMYIGYWAGFQKNKSLFFDYTLYKECTRQTGYNGKFIQSPLVFSEFCFSVDVDMD